MYLRAGRTHLLARVDQVFEKKGFSIHATIAMSPRMRMTIPRAPCGTAMCTDRTMEPICMMFPRFSRSRLYDVTPVKVIIKASLRR
jgi:hypothetical protein